MRNEDQKELHALEALAAHPPRRWRPWTSTRNDRTKLPVNKVPRPKNNDTVANPGLYAQFRRAADALRNRMVPVEYKHVIFGLIVLKHISDAFEEPRTTA